jgi:Leucine-rich repeat (LRR) protein
LELPSRLKVLKCGLNKIKQLKLPKELVELDSSVNPIEHLDIEHTQLETLWVVNSPLLWSISELPATLRVVRLSHNSLHKLPDSFYSKKYDALDISHNPWTDATLAKLRKYARRNNEKELFNKVLSMQKISDHLHHKFQTYKKSKTRVCASNSRLNDLIPNMQKYFAGSVRKTKKKKRVKSFF